MPNDTLSITITLHPMKISQQYRKTDISMRRLKYLDVIGQIGNLDYLPQHKSRHYKLSFIPRDVMESVEIVPFT